MVQQVLRNRYFVSREGKPRGIEWPGQQGRAPHKQHVSLRVSGGAVDTVQQHPALVDRVERTDPDELLIPSAGAGQIDEVPAVGQETRELLRRRSRCETGRRADDTACRGDLMETVVNARCEDNR